MKKSFVLVVLVFISFSLLLGGCGNGDADADTNGVELDETVELNFVGAYVDAHPTSVNAFKPWIEEVNEYSNGQLKIHFYAINTLCPESETFDAIVSGFVNIGSNYCGNTPGKFPYAEVLEMPLLVKSAESGSLVMMELFEMYPEIQNEFCEVELLWMWTSATYNLHTTNKEVRTLEDLQGMRIIGWSPNVLEILKHLGANPIEISALDTYMALERGMADGVLCPLAPVRSFKISDVAKHHTVVDLLVGPFFSVINKETYDSLPENLKNIINETTGMEMARRCGVSLDQGAIEDSKWMKGEGHTFYVLPNDERERWIEAVSPMWDDWVETMEKNGFPKARAILESAIELGEKYDEITGRGYVE
jgi:TRAP-type C4-dicarboxylate transport system substrate-binding protein